MADGEKVDQLIEQIKQLVIRLDKPNKDVKGWLTILTSFLASVVIAALTLYYSNKESVRGSEERQRSFEYNQMRDSFQAEIQKANLRVDELKALKELIPSLASKDAGTRAIAIQLLRASATGSTEQNTPAFIDTPGSRKTHSGTKEIAANTSSVIDKFYSLLAIAGSSAEPDSKRQQALKEAEPLLTSNNISEADRKKGLTIVSGIATSPSTPEPVRVTAERVIANIKKVNLDELPEILASEKITRPVNSIILHHTGAPFTSENFKGASTIFNIARFQTSQMNWNRISWHYAIAPDGSIWLGMPLNEMSIHAREQNKTSVSILLIVDGDKELPTEAQRTTLPGLLELLFSKLHLQATNLHTHRFYNPEKTCPGTLITEAYLTGLIP